MAKTKKEAAASSPATTATCEGSGDETAGIELARKIAKVLDECRLSHAVHNRKIKDLSSLLTSHPSLFVSSFLHSLTPLFHLPRRSPSSDRVARLVSTFAATTSSSIFQDQFLRFLIVASSSAHKPARFRSCQIISEIVMRLPDDADVSGEVWDEVIECMKQRAGDKVPTIRALAVRALSRFSVNVDVADIIDVFLRILLEEPNAEVRKTIVLSMPPTSETAAAIIDRTLDVSESVRKAAYWALAAKFPLHSFSIKQRAVILVRGLADRSGSVRAECLRMLKEKWLPNFCNGDPIILLKSLDVETYESVGEAVMKALLEDGAMQLPEGQSLKQLIVTTPGNGDSDIQLIEPECALYWRIMCEHLQMEAQSKGLDAATTMGAEAAIYASQASFSNDLLEDVLPATISDYVTLVKGHLSAGSDYRYVARQLLLLGGMLDFSDLTNKKVASALVQELLHCPPAHEVDDEGNKIVIGDGINLGGDRDWAKAVSGLAKKVHASACEFEDVVAIVIEELAGPCRERIADPLQWMHCLAVTGLLLENVESFLCLQGKAMDPVGLHSLLLSGAKHIHIEVQRAAIRCLCLFGLLDRNVGEDLVRQLRISFISGSSPVSIMACKALIDLATWHGSLELDKAIGVENFQLCDRANFIGVDLDVNEDTNAPLLDLLYAGFDHDWLQCSDSDDQETVQCVLGEGFAKMLLLSENHSTIVTSLHPFVLTKLISLHFSTEIKELGRLKQCLAVFFEHYPALSDTHKKCLSKAFVPVMRSMWPGIYGNAGGSNYHVSRMRKRATQASQFMLQMMQTTLISTELQDEENCENGTSDICPGAQSLSDSDIDFGEEGLALRIAAEVIRWPQKKNAHERSYVSALCRTVALLNFRSSKQAAVKCMRVLLNCMIESVSADKESVKELNWLASRLKALDTNPDEEPSKDSIKELFEKLEIDTDVGNLNTSFAMTMPPTPAAPSARRSVRVAVTPAAPRSTRATATKRRVRNEETSSEDDDVAVDCPPVSTVTPAVRSQRASKTAALSKMTTKTTISLPEEEDEVISEVASEVDSGQSSDESW